MAAGHPERFAQEALSHYGKAVHRAHVKRTLMKIPSLQEYELDADAKTKVDFRNLCESIPAT